MFFYRWNVTITVIVVILIIIYCIDFMLVSQYDDASTLIVMEPLSQTAILNISHTSNQLDTKPIFVDTLNNHNIEPWDALNANNIIHKIHNLTKKHIMTNIPENSNEYFNASPSVEIIQNIDDVASEYKTCSNIHSSGYKLPVGIPSYSDTIWYNDSFISKHPKWKICIIYSSNTYLAGLTMFNKAQYYAFYMTHVQQRNLRCYRNKTTKHIVNSLYFNNDKKHINMVLLITGNAVASFQHFMINIPIRFAMLYQWLLSVIEVTNNSEYYLNITIATYIDWRRKNSIHVWFWKQFGFNQGINTINNNINITVMHVEAWCAKYNWQWFAPLVIAPYFIDPYVYWNDHYASNMVYHHRQMFAFNSLRSIKPVISYMDAERDTIIYLQRSGYKRRVVNNNDVVQYLNESAVQNGYKFMIYACCHKANHFDEDKEIFSRALIVIGPHGGMFANLLFVPFGSYVIEFNNWFGDISDAATRDRPIYYTLAQANGLHYFYLSPNDFSYNKPMTINMTQMDTLISNIYKRILKQ